MQHDSREKKKGGGEQSHKTVANTEKLFIPGLTARWAPFLKELVYALTRHMRAVGATMVATMEIPELLGSALISGHGISFVADNLLQLRYIEGRDALSAPCSSSRCGASITPRSFIGLNCRLEVCTLGRR